MDLFLCGVYTPPRQRRVHKITRRNTDDSSWSKEDSHSFDDVITIESLNKTEKHWMADIKVNNTVHPFKIDSDADVTAMSVEAFYQIQTAKLPLKATKKILFGPCKDNLNSIGTFNAELRHEKELVKRLERFSLGRQPAQRLNLINRVDIVTSMKKIQEKYPTLFTGLGQTKNYEYDIKVTKDAQTLALTNPRQGQYHFTRN